MQKRSAWRRWVWGFVGGLAVSAVGVSTSGCQARGARSDTAALAGRVSIDGVPVPKGSVQFMPLDHGQPAFSEVRDGAYAARVPKGRVQVLFSAPKETGRLVQVYSSKVPEIVDALPPSLRDGVEITVDGDDPNRDFSLSSKPSPRQEPPPKP